MDAAARCLNDCAIRLRFGGHRYQRTCLATRRCVVPGRLRTANRRKNAQAATWTRLAAVCERRGALEGQFSFRSVTVTAASVGAGVS